MAVSNEPSKPPVTIQISYEDVMTWLRENLVHHWERSAYVVIVVFAAGLRLWDLGVRSFNHDESLHATFSWYVYMGRGYEHDPMMHGPFQFFLNAGLWKFLAFLSSAPFLNNFAHWGPNDFTGRLSYALFGIALVLLPLFLRNYIGRVGAVFAALFIAVSPVIVYFSRFARNDIFIGVFTVGIVICMWRYLTERRTLFLYLIAGLLALSFATKETTFLTAAMFLIFLDILFAWDITEQIRLKSESSHLPEQLRSGSPVAWSLLFVCLIPFAWLIAIVWPLTEKTRARWKLDQWPGSGDLLIIIATLAGVQFAAGVQMLPFIGDKGYYRDVAGGENGLMKMSVFLFLVIAAYIGLLWKPRTWLIAAGIFYVIFVLLYTSFFTNMGGFWSGIWGSFDYWLQQQHVQRGDQPVYYYLMLLPMYDFLPLLIALAGGLYFLLRRNFLFSAAAVLAVLVMVYGYFTFFSGLVALIPVLVILGVVLFLLRVDVFTSFLIFWAAASLIAYATAGEKMPWLTVHMTIPIIILAAKSLGSLYERFKLSFPLRWGAPEMLVILAAAAGGLSTIILWTSVFSSTGAVLALLLGVVAIALVVRATASHGRLLGAQTAAALLIPALFVVTVRDTFRANFDLGTFPREILSYADTSPGIPWARDELVTLGKESGLATDYPIVIDNDIAWPFVWYTRDYKVQWASGSMTPPVAGSLVVIATSHESWMEPYLDQYYQPQPIRHLWWFGDGPQFYQGVTATSFAKDLFDSSVWNVWRNYFVWRQVPWQPAPDDVLVYIPKTYATGEGQPLELPPSIPTVTVATEDQTVFGQGDLNQPTDVTLDSAGNVWIADGSNSRILEYDTDGKLLQTLKPTGDEALSEPWSVAVDSKGSIYISDTWYQADGEPGVGRVVKYDSKLNLVWSTSPDVNFFGPRDIVTLSDGNILVSDTGNKRIVKLDAATGDVITTFGEDGSGPGQFNEPVGLAVASNGDLYVADTWNGRVQHFDSNFAYIGEFKVKGWGSTEVTAKPFLTVLADGRVILSNPANSQIELYDEQGQAVVAWQLPAPAAGTSARPVGIETDSQGNLYVVDCSGNLVYRIPVSDLTEATPASTPTSTP